MEQLPIGSNISLEKIYDKSHSPLRWLFLLISVFFISASYYTYDIPAASQVALEEYFNIGDRFALFYQLMYTSYSLPNIPWPAFAGIMVDKIGVRRSNSISTFIVALGQLIVCLAIQFKYFNIAFLGRAVFGVGVEMVCISARMLTEDWFRGNGVELAFGILLSVGRLSSIVNNAITALFDSADVVYAYYLGLGLCVLAFLLAVAAEFLETSYESRQIKKSGLSASAVNRLRPRTVPTTPLEHVRSIIASFRSWPYQFWLLALLTAVGYACIAPFNHILETYLVWSFDHFNESTDPERVNLSMSVMFLTAAVMANLAGLTVERLGGKVLTMTTSLVVIAVGITIMGIFPMPSPGPQIMLGLLGTAFAYFGASCWPLVSWIVPKASIGAAYGALAAVQNAGLSIVPLIQADLQPPRCGGGFLCACLLFAGVAMLGLPLGLWLLFSTPAIERSSGRGFFKNSALLPEEGAADEDEGAPYYQGPLDRVLLRLLPCARRQTVKLRMRTLHGPYALRGMSVARLAREPCVYDILALYGDPISGAKTLLGEFAKDAHSEASSESLKEYSHSEQKHTYSAYKRERRSGALRGIDYDSNHEEALEMSLLQNAGNDEVDRDLIAFHASSMGQSTGASLDSTGKIAFHSKSRSYEAPPVTPITRNPPSGEGTFSKRSGLSRHFKEGEYNQFSGDQDTPSYLSQLHSSSDRGKNRSDDPDYGTPFESKNLRLQKSIRTVSVLDAELERALNENDAIMNLMDDVLEDPELQHHFI